MGVLDRIKARGQDQPSDLPESLQPDSSPTLVADDPAVVQRINHVMEYFLSQMGGEGKAGQFKRMLAMISRDAMEEMKDAPPEAIEFYFRRAAGLIYWSACGERILNIPWPKDFAPPSELDAPQQEALESA
jgi:hypothetical protein